MTSWDKQCTQSLFRNTQCPCHQDLFLSYTLQTAKRQQCTCISLYIIPCQKSSAQPWMQEFIQVWFFYMFWTIQNNLSEKWTERKKYYMSDGERFLHYFFNKHSNRERSRTITIGHKMTTFYGIKTDPPSLNAEVCPRDTSIATWIL